MENASFVCPTCGSAVDIADIKPEIRPIKNGWAARDAIRGLVAHGSSEALAVANLKGTISAYEHGLARYQSATGRSTK